MRIELKARGLKLTRGLREHMQRRLHFALGRLSDRIRRVVMTIDDINGPRGGEDKRCRVVVEGRRDWNLTLTDVDADLYAAINQATRRVGQAVSRRVERHHRPVRSNRQISL